MLIRNLYICVLLMLLFGATSYSQDLPPRIPNTYVQDHANVLSPQDEAEVQQSLKALKEKYNLEFSIALVDSTGLNTIESYGLRMARAYGIGSKDNEKRGLLLLIAVQDRRWNWQISRQMESVITDGQSGEIGRKILTPNLKAAIQTNQSRDWKVALITTIKAMDAHIQNHIEPEKKQPVISPSNNSDDSSLWAGCCGGVLLLMGLVYGLNAYSSGAGEREMKKRKKKEAEARMRFLASPAGIAWTEAQNKLAAEKAAEEAEQLRIQEERDREAQRIRDEERRKHEHWLKSTPEGRKEAKRLARIREAMEESTISPVIPSTYDDSPSFSSSPSYSTSDDDSSSSFSTDSSSSSDSFSGGTGDFGGGGSSGDF